MLCREIIAVCSEIHTKHINTLCGQNVQFVNVKPAGTYSNHWALKGSGDEMLAHFCLPICCLRIQIINRPNYCVACFVWV
jgi:hypothetical protein